MKKTIVFSILTAVVFYSAFAQLPINPGYNSSLKQNFNSYPKSLQVDKNAGENVIPGNNEMDAHPQYDSSAIQNFWDFDKDLSAGNNDYFNSGYAGIMKGGGYNSSATMYLYDFEKNQSEVYQTADITGISRNDAGTSIIVCNPVYDYISINANENVNIKRIEVFNIQGSLQLTESTNGNNLQIPAGRLESGVYLIRIYFETGCYTKQIYKT